MHPHGKSFSLQINRNPICFHHVGAVKSVEATTLIKACKNKLKPTITHFKKTCSTFSLVNNDNELLPQWPSNWFVLHVCMSARRGGCSINRHHLKNYPLLSPSSISAVLCCYLFIKCIDDESFFSSVSP